MTEPATGGDSGKVRRLSKAVWVDFGYLGLVVLAWIALSVGIALRQQSGTAGIEQSLLNAANDVNRQLPVMVDKDTRADSVVAGPGLKFTNIYTLVNYSSQQITSQVLEQKLAPNIRNSTCTDKNRRSLLDRGVQFVYRYMDKDDIAIGDVVVSATDCKS